MKSFHELGNEPYYDFSDSSVLAELEKAKQSVSKRLGKTFSLFIDGDDVVTKETFPSVNPADTSQTLGYFPKASKEQVTQVIDYAQKTFDEVWGENVEVEKRSEIIRKVADLASKRKMELSVILSLEVGKSMLEACAGVAEFIDFARAYAEQAVAIEHEDPGLLKVPEQTVQHRYRPFGVGAVIGPFNFPIAITGGLSCATLVTGNTLVLKPSSDAPLSAYAFQEICMEAGMPSGVFNIVTGAGSEIGDTLLTHPSIKLVSFTGSVATGLHIREVVNRAPKEGEWLKVIPALEMGGKNATIVDEGVDLDLAVDAVWSGAFGYNGQKCSACSRAYVHGSLYDAFRDALIKKVNALKIGQGINPENYITAVVNKKAKEKILKYIDIAKQEGGKILTGGQALEEGEYSNGYFVQPTVVEGLPTGSRLEMEEIFGPVLALFKVNSFDEALERVRNCYYGLTGSIITNNDEHKQRAAALPIGNYYINRKCTGAMVGREPFGGVKFSGPYGTGPGGKDFLRRFYWTQSVSEML